MMYVRESVHVVGELVHAHVCAFVKLTVICGGTDLPPI